VKVDSPFRCLSYNYAAPGIRRDGTSVVLKLSFPEDKEFHSEAEALRWFDGRGIARLLELDLARGAMLLERLEPGTPLSGLDDEEATSIAAGVMRRLWRPAPADRPFPTVAYWASGIQRLLQNRYGGGTGPLPAALVEEAERRFAELLASSEEQALLHGDLHHGNILRARREPWLAIDPKGVVGEPAYETAALLHNPRPGLLDMPNPRRVLARRIDQLSEELGFDRERIHAWGFAQCVLSAVWSLDDHGAGWEFAITCAELLAGIKL
jgi:streptomycin 6-kinase